MDEPMGDGANIQVADFEPKIVVEKIHELATFEKAHISDVGYDLTCCTVQYNPQYDYYEIGLGVKVIPPLGYYFHCYMRSSFPKTGFVMLNGVGIIDPGYRGEWKMVVGPHSLRGDIYESIGKKVAQAVLIQSVYTMEIQEEKVDGSKTDRGEGGFGSTGS